mmetsp:Transcript_6841/g.8940  ORF Transcript_6841/g.8940 Transcript_6841/m.8940 type:complete len:789 (+) Transcript_6841:150-2516(+)|eukprot:CAMPEP_0204864802 /NCGR_PEP_ID=MMETSP1348-20121228/4322_1 /ASSEMBLY_ACC=CAM_ASM_000700 /TAXON_ID=215587 /ORGANISM="Aplanochytrium stocchinoi, Strain GSBS06" /LENGTH=788 /DNA_ID=CAMNT_0052015547 /DNA_START=141 /DNA_END=2507 /DNA_ORIENTATION=-
MSSKSKVKKIGGNWVETVDPNSGKTYYANVVTKETTWSYPTQQIKKEVAEQKKQQKKQDAAARKTAGGGGNKDVWVERQDPQGRVYYYNRTSKVTSWYRPEENNNVISTGALQADDGAGKWVSRQDPRSGRVYYYNPVLKQTSWTNPDEEAAKEAAKSKQGMGQRLSMSLKAGASNTTKRLSQVGKRLSNLGGGGEINRNSARFSLSMPANPINKSENRASIRLGRTSVIGEDGRLSIGGDPFAKLRALKNIGYVPDKVDDEISNEELAQALKIDLEKMEEGIAHDEVDDTLSFSKYANDFFNTVQKKKAFGGGGQPLEVRKMILFETRPLKQPLHDISNKDLVYDSLLAFKVMMMYCGDKSSKKQPWYHAQVFLATCIAPVEELHDEIFCQLIKQSSGNPNQKSLERVWELMAMTCGLIIPSKTLMPYLKSHITHAIESPKSEHMKRFASYAMLRLKKAENLEPRVEVPSRAEVEAAMNHSPLTTSISLINEFESDVEIETWTTIRDVCSAMCRRLQIKDGTPFACFELNEEEDERVLEPDDRVTDILAYWDREMSKNSKKQFKLQFKVRLFFDINEEDTRAVELCYYQAVFDVTDSRYPCSREDAIILAAFECQEKFGDYDGTDVLGPDAKFYVQAKYYSPETEGQLKEEIYRQYAQFAGYDKMACKVNYLDYIKAWKWYGSSYFLVQTVTYKILGKEFPKNIILAVNTKGVLIVDPNDPSRELLADFPYSDIVTWGYSAKNFVLVVGNLVRSQKLFFETDEGSELNSLIHAYVNKLLEAEKAEMR